MGEELTSPRGSLRVPNPELNKDIRIPLPATKPSSALGNQSSSASQIWDCIPSVGLRCYQGVCRDMARLHCGLQDPGCSIAATSSQPNQLLAGTVSTGTSL